ncbi:hypothetical protein D3C87_1380560 [compost metagenome]
MSAIDGGLLIDNLQRGVERSNVVFEISCQQPGRVDVIPGQQNVVRLIEECHFVLRVTGHADQTHLQTTKVDGLVWLY